MRLRASRPSTAPSPDPVCTTGHPSPPTCESRGEAWRICPPAALLQARLARAWVRCGAKRAGWLRSRAAESCRGWCARGGSELCWPAERLRRSELTLQGYPSEPLPFPLTLHPPASHPQRSSPAVCLPGFGPPVTSRPALRPLSSSSDPRPPAAGLPCRDAPSGVRGRARAQDDRICAGARTPTRAPAPAPAPAH